MTQAGPDPDGSAPAATSADGERPEAPIRLLAAAPHRVVEHTVGMSDVDAVQIYFATYLLWVGSGYEGLFADLGHPIDELMAEGQIQPVVNVEARYSSPVGLGARVRQQTTLISVGGSSLVLRDQFYEDDRLLATVETVRAWVDTTVGQKTTPAPDWIRAVIREGPPDDRHP